MKTITSFLITLVLLLLSGLIFSFFLSTLSSSFTPYFSNETGELVDHSIPLLIYGFIQLVVSLYILINAVKTFKLFLKFYTNYRTTKRDNDIHKAVEDAKYDALFKEMQNTNLPDKLEDVVKTFYEDKEAEDKNDNFAAFMDMLQSRSAKHSRHANSSK